MTRIACLRVCAQNWDPMWKSSNFTSGRVSAYDIYMSRTKSIVSELNLLEWPRILMPLSLHSETLMNAVYKTEFKIYIRSNMR
ncbi:selenide, water dikinase [Sesbania bispinosa]|nr:selenide, water dikinase [Sesbania bispinosa]KAJ1442509.1 selenide, water dikinase [Sesbania bispinosa]